MNLNKTKNKILSLNHLPENIQIYFSNLKPTSKREREIEDFKSIQEHYPLTEITNALDIDPESEFHGYFEKMCFSITPFGWLQVESPFQNIHSRKAFAAISITYKIAQMTLE